MPSALLHFRVRLKPDAQEALGFAQLLTLDEKIF